MTVIRNGLKYNGWRVVRDHQSPFKPGDKNRDVVKIPTTKLFDNVSWIGDRWVGCFAINAPEGLMLIDTMMAKPDYHSLLLEGICDLGYEPSDVVKILITHGHGDHWGNAAYFVEEYGAELCMSEVDYRNATREDYPSPSGPLKKVPCTFVKDGDMIHFGSTTIKVYETPGHSEGCLSFIFNVEDSGRPHKVALWGGVGAPKTEYGRLQYLKSCDYFIEKIIEEGADCEISTHPFVDMTKERLDIVRNIVDGENNPYVIGVDANIRYHLEFKHTCERIIEEAKG